jgi:hypothetical protein
MSVAPASLLPDDASPHHPQSIFPRVVLHSSEAMDRLLHQLVRDYGSEIREFHSAHLIAYLMEMAQKESAFDRAAKAHFVYVVFSRVVGEIHLNRHQPILQAMTASFSDQIKAAKAIYRQAPHPFKPAPPFFLKDYDEYVESQARDLYLIYSDSILEWNVAPLVYSVYALSPQCTHLSEAEHIELQLQIMTRTLQIAFPEYQTEQKEAYQALLHVVSETMTLYDIASLRCMDLPDLKTAPKKCCQCTLS